MLLVLDATKHGLICGRQCRDLNALPFCCTPLHCIGSRGLLEIDVLALCYCRVWRARPRPRPANQFFDVHKAIQASAAAAGSGYLLRQFLICYCKIEVIPYMLLKIVLSLVCHYL